MLPKHHLELFLHPVLTLKPQLLPPPRSGMAIIGTEGFGSLPMHCATLMAGFFGMAVAICVLRDLLPKKFTGYIPRSDCRR